MKVDSLLLLVLFGACSSVELPQEHFYRLATAPGAVPAPAPLAENRLGKALRVERIQLAANVDTDRLMVAQGPVRLRPYEFHHWAGPLDRMIADSVILGLDRASKFQIVKGPGDAGVEDLVLTGRVLEFHQSIDQEGWCGVVAMHLHLRDRDGRILSTRELRHTERAAVATPESVVEALSVSLDAVVGQAVAWIISSSD